MGRKSREEERRRGGGAEEELGHERRRGGVKMIRGIIFFIKISTQFL